MTSADSDMEAIERNPSQADGEIAEADTFEGCQGTEVETAAADLPAWEMGLVDE
jgi:hypothetical protein